MTWTSHNPVDVPSPVFEEKDNALSIRLTSPRSIGWWQEIRAVESGETYQFTSEAIIPKLADNNVSVVLTWSRTPDDSRMIQRDYLEFTQSTPDRRLFSGTFTAPADSHYVIVWCMFKWLDDTAIFSPVTMQKRAVVPSRKATLVAANITPAPHPTIEANLAIIEKVLERICTEVNHPDFILLPEAHTGRGVNLPIGQRAEPIPDGPTFKLCARFAAQYKTYIVGNVTERGANGSLYNTSFIVDRTGHLCGIYHKVHLTLSEQTGGVIPGTEFPVFDLDFGRVGLGTCWDFWFTETARMLRLNGAEFFGFPLAGDAKESHWSKTWSTRCIDNGIPMVVSVNDPKVPSCIVDRDGTWLSQTLEEGGYAVSTLDLNERKRSFWLSVGPADGDPYQLYIKERRPATYNFKKL